MKVYLLSTGEYSDRFVVDVFDSRDLALESARRRVAKEKEFSWVLESYGIEEDDGALYHKYINDRGRMTRVYFGDIEEFDVIAELPPLEGNDNE